MNPKTLCVASILFFSLFSKHALESDGIGKRHLPKNLKPLEASYESRSLERFSFGFESLLSSLLWIQVLQRNEHTPLASDEVSWEFAQIDAITRLDPRFDQAYSFGSIFLSVLRRDKLGGKIILEKWGNRYPTYWRPVHLLGMHYYEELGDYASAAPLILRASTMANAPKWLNSLGLRLLSDSGSLVNAVTTAVEMSKITPDPERLQFLTNRIRSLNYKQQKTAYENSLRRKSQIERQISSEELFSDPKIPSIVKKTLEEKFIFPRDLAFEGTLGKTGIFPDISAVKRNK